MYLKNITLNQHEDGYGYDLEFHFEKNSYFNNESLKKSYKMKQENVIESIEGTKIEWQDGCDVTIKKVKKKQKNKKSGEKKTITKEVKQDSFFNFFDSLDIPDVQDLIKSKLAGGQPKEDSEGDEDDANKDAGEKMDEDFEIGNKFKDWLVPLGLEFYLGVISDDEEEEEGEGDDDSDDSDNDKKKKKGKKDKADEGEGEKKECK
jgi:hypothetical protein